MSKLVIVPPAGRATVGRGVLLGERGQAEVLGPFRVLGTASESAASRNGNPGRDWRKPFGDTPTGSYLVAGALPPSAKRRGLVGALILAPASGNAVAALAAGRTRFLLHGGALEDDCLRATYGGLRIADQDLAVLVRVLNERNARGDALTSVEVVEMETLPWHEPPKKRPTRRDVVGLALVSLAALTCGGREQFADVSVGEAGGDGGGTDGGYDATNSKSDKAVASIPSRGTRTMPPGGLIGWRPPPTAATKERRVGEDSTDASTDASDDGIDGGLDDGTEAGAGTSTGDSTGTGTGTGNRRRAREQEPAPATALGPAPEPVRERATAPAPGPAPAPEPDTARGPAPDPVRERATAPAPAPAQAPVTEREQEREQAISVRAREQGR